MALPPVIQQSPIVQTMRWMFRPIAYMQSARRELGETFGVMFIGFQTPMYMLSEPEAIKAIYTNRENGMPPGRNIVLEPVMGPRSILLLEGAEHMARRKLMLPPFHGERMRAYEDEITAVITDEIDSWALHSEFAIHERMQAVTLEVILKVVFGITDETRLAKLRERLGVVLHQTASPLLQLVGLASRRFFGERGIWARFQATLEQVDGLLYEEIAARRADPKLREGDDILSMLMSATFEDGEPMSDEELRDQLMTLLLAGHETTATALAWTFDLLLRNPAAMDRLRDEIEAGEGDDYLRAVISEALRLRPVIPIAGRRLVEPLEVDGYHLPAGTDVAPSIYLTHTRPDVYPDPYAFKPERFLDDGPETYSWIPFGGGVRRCLGAAFAEFEMRIVLTEVIGRCRLQSAHPDPQGIARRNITFSPRNGTPVIVTERRARREAPAPVAA
jgi:cytochrome P450